MSSPYRNVTQRDLAGPDENHHKTDTTSRARCCVEQDVLWAPTSSGLPRGRRGSWAM